MEILLPVDSMLPVLCPDSVDLTDVTAARAGDRHAEAHIASVLRTEYEALAPIEAIDGSAQHFVVSPAIPDPPESLETDIERLKGLMREGEYDAAQALVDRVLPMAPTQAILHRIAGAIPHRRQDFDLSLAAYRRGVLWAPDDALLNRSLGQVLLLIKGDEEHAVMCFDRAMSLRPDDVYVAVDAASMFIATMRWERAGHYLARAADIDPENGHVLAGQALVASESGEPYSAFRLGVRGLLALSPEADEYESTLALVDLSADQIIPERQDEYDEAVDRRARETAMSVGRAVELRHDPHLPVPAILQPADGGGTDAVHLITYGDGDAATYHMVFKHLITLRRLVESVADGSGRVIAAAGVEGDASTRRAVMAAVGQLAATPQDLIAEVELHTEEPDLRLVQYLGVRRQGRVTEEEIASRHAAIEARSASSAPSALDRRLARASTCVNLVSLLVYRRLYGADRDRELPGDETERSLAQRMEAVFMREIATGAPDADVRIAQEWAVLLELEEIVVVLPRTAPGPGPGVPPGAAVRETEADTGTVAEPGGTHHGRIVASIVAALDHFATLDRAGIVAIAEEISRRGGEGINPNDPATVYRLDSVPDATFAGSGLLAWLYAAFRVLEADVDPGFDYAAEFDEAQSIRAARERRKGAEDL